MKTNLHALKRKWMAVISVIMRQLNQFIMIEKSQYAREIAPSKVRIELLSLPAVIWGSHAAPL